MFRILLVSAALTLVCSSPTETLLARGFGGGGHLGGGGFGGLGGGAIGGGRLGAGGLGAGGLGAGGLGAGGLAGGGLAGGRLGGGSLAGGLAGGDLRSRLGAAGLGGLNGAGLNGGGLARQLSDVNPQIRRPDIRQPQIARPNIGGGQLIDSGRRPTTSGLDNFLGLPADQGLHHLSGETQSAGSRLYDKVKSGDRPFSNFISGQTQKPGSRIYDNIKAGDGPFKNFIPGETQSFSSRAYDYMRANHPLQPTHPWRRHNNAIVIRNNFNYYNLYTPAYFATYPGAWYPAYWATGNAWTIATWAELNAWLALSAAQPVNYDYGSNVVYQDNSVYVNNQSVGSADQYYQQAQDIAEAGTEDGGKDQKWMSLGVFALTHGDQTKATMILELAVNKQGVIRGNYTNTTANHTLPVQGAVDKQTQRAAWTIGDDSNNVMETGLDNLTKDEAPLLVHFGKDKSEQWLLVRIQKNQAGATIK